MPVISLDDELLENEIFLEGAEVSKTTYAELYSIYGDTYGTPESEDNFVLPDARGRVIQGAEDFGYLEAELPNVKGSISNMMTHSSPLIDGFIYKGSSVVSNLAAGSSSSYYTNIFFDMSRSSSLYKDGGKMQPPAIKVRVKTRYV